MALVTKTVFLTTTGQYSYTIPNDFISLVSVEAIGGGGGSYISGTSAGGAGGGAYSKSTTMTGLTPNGTAYYNVGVGGTSGAPSNTNGGDSWFNVAANSAPSISSSGANGVLAKGGTKGGTQTAGTAGGSGSGGAASSGAGDVRTSGGAGGDSSGAHGNGAGGGAGGPGGNGGAGGASAATGINSSGSGGGGAGGLYGAGSNGVAGAVSNVGGAGGNSGSLGLGGTGGGSATLPGTATNGGGGGGAGGNTGSGFQNGGAGANGTIWTSSVGVVAGPGGGAGSPGAAVGGNCGTPGLYGGGASNGGVAVNGAQGIIVFTYIAQSGSGFLKDDTTFGTIDLDDQYVTDSWLVDKYVGGKLWAWGYNDSGQLGIGNTTAYSSPVQVGALNSWRDIDIVATYPYGTAAALKNDGTLWMWGSNALGQLGQGNTTYFSSPVQVGTLTNWKQVSLGFQNNCYVHAVKTDGTLWAWGRNSAGNLGNGNTTDYSSPVQIGTLTNWKQVANGGLITAAIKQDGTLWTWGDNVFGALGISVSGATSYYSSPVQVGALTNWKSVYVANWLGGSTLRWPSCFAIKTDGTLWTWGVTSFGNLGIGVSAITYYSSPIQVGALTNWKQISGGGSGVGQPFTVAVKTDGTLWSWGSNAYGQLGQGYSGNYYSSPIQVGSLTNWKQVSAKPACNSWAAIKTDGTLWFCGATTSGSAGNGSTGYYSSPVQVGSLTNWKKVVTTSLLAGNSSSFTLGITFTDLN
jgi:alpha-tubulin suppressor-like RCC1 family protein